MPFPVARCSKLAIETRRQALEAIENDRLHTAAAKFARAESMCPTSCDSTSDVHARVLLNLGRFEQAQALLSSAQRCSSSRASLQQELPSLKAKWNATTPETLFELAQGREQTRDGKRLLEQSFERARQSSRANPEIQAFNGLDGIVAAGLTPDGVIVTAADSFNYGRFDLKRGTTTGRTLDFGRLLAVASSGSGALIAIPRNDKAELHCLDTTSGEVLPALAMPDPNFEAYEQQIGVALTPDGTRAAAYVTPIANSDGTSPATNTDHVVLWNCRTGNVDAVLTPERGYADLVANLSFSPSGKLLGMSGRVGTVVVWDIERKTVVLDDADLTCMQCDGTELLALGTGRIFWALDESVLVTQSSNADRRLFYLTKRAPILAAVPEGVVAVLDDGHTLVSQSEFVDLATGNTTARPHLDLEGAVAGGRFLVNSGNSSGQVKLSSLFSDGTRSLAERHSGPFDSISLKNRTLVIGGRVPLRFSLPEVSTTTSKTAWEVNRGDDAYIELRDATDASSTWRPWVPCVTSQGPLYWLPPSVLAIPCGTELVFATTATPGVVARLRHIEGTDTTYALFADGTAELFGRIDDLRRVARCVLGSHSYPLELCEDELLVPGRLQLLLLQRDVPGVK